MGSVDFLGVLLPHRPELAVDEVVPDAADPFRVLDGCPLAAGAAGRRLHGEDVVGPAAGVALIADRAMVVEFAGAGGEECVVHVDHYTHGVGQTQAQTEDFLENPKKTF